MAGKQFKGLAKDFINAMKTQFIGQGADPNNIIVQDLFNYSSPDNRANSPLKIKSNSLDELRTMSAEDRSILSTLLAVYNEHIQTKREILTQSRNMFDTDIVQTVIDVMIDDDWRIINNLAENSIKTIYFRDTNFISRFLSNYFKYFF